MFEIVNRVLEVLEDDYFEVMTRFRMRQQTKGSDEHRRSEDEELLGVNAEDGNDVEATFKAGTGDEENWKPLSKGILGFSGLSIRCTTKFMKANRDEDWIDEFLDEFGVETVMTQIEKIDRVVRVKVLSNTLDKESAWQYVKKNKLIQWWVPSSWQRTIEHFLRKQRVDILDVEKHDKDTESKEESTNSIHTMSERQLKGFIRKHTLPINHEEYASKRALKSAILQYLGDLGLKAHVDPEIRPQLEEV